MRIGLTATAFVLAIATIAFAQDEKSRDTLVAQLSGETDAPTRDAAALRKAYDDMLEALLPGMSAEAIPDRETDQSAFERICMHASRPGADAERVALCEATLARVAEMKPSPARVWMLLKMPFVAGEESVAGLAALLSDDDARTRELARRALERIPGKAVEAALLTALKDAKNADDAVAYINALGARGSADAVDALAERLKGDDASVVAAAVSALGRIPTTHALNVLVAQFSAAKDEHLADALANAALICCDALVDAGETAAPRAFYSLLYKREQLVKRQIAALAGFVRIDGEAALPMVLDQIKSDDTTLDAVAAGLATQIPGESATAAIAAALDDENVEVPAKLKLLDVLEWRGDRSALPAVLQAFDGHAGKVRIAAVRVLGVLGGADEVVAIAESAGNGKTIAERQTAQTSLRELRGEDVEDRIVAELDQTRGKVKAELIRAVEVRRITSAIPKLEKALDGHGDVVQIAAAAALGTLGGADNLPALAELFRGNRPSQLRWTCSDAMIKIAKRDGAIDRCIDLMLERYRESNGTIQAEVMQAMGVIGGDRALVALRNGLDAGDGTVVLAAIRAMSQWDNADAAEDLIHAAETSDEPRVSILALRGYVNLIRKSDAPPAAVFVMYERAMKLAKRAPERTLVLGGLANVADSRALTTIMECVDDEPTREVAASAALTQVRRMIGADATAAKAALDKVLELTLPDAMREQANGLAEAIAKDAGYCTAWSFAGPYTKEGADGAAIFDIAFAPEPGESGDVNWKYLKTTDADSPWNYDLTKGAAMDNAALYVCTEVYAPAETEATLELGSDDGVKAWLNDKVVHANNVPRAAQRASDKVKVTLHEGWNPLLLKIVQRAGGWAFCCGLRTTDGGAVEGLRFRAGSNSD